MVHPDTPAPEELIEMLIRAGEAMGGTAWWDGEEVCVLFGGRLPPFGNGTRIRLIVKFDGFDVQSSVSRRFRPRQVPARP